MENMFSENMNQISLATNHLDSYEFTVAVNNFEVFLEQQYLHRSEQKSVQELLNDIFNEIVVIKNPLAAVIIVKLLTKVKFDDKVQKAIKISHHISGIGFDQNPIYWLYLADVLEYLCRIIPKSMFQIFSTLYSNISKESNSQKIAELSLLFVSMMYSRFDEFVDKIAFFLGFRPNFVFHICDPLSKRHFIIFSAGRWRAGCGAGFRPGPESPESRPRRLA